jgi:hypothetical protein
MHPFTRREVIGLGAVCAPALLGEVPQGDGEKARDEQPVRFKITDATILKVNQPGRTIDVHFGKPTRPIKMSDLPLDKEIRIRVSHVFPGVVNNVPFDWARLKGLAGRVVSLVIVATENRLAVATIATANDRAHRRPSACRHSQAFHHSPSSRRAQSRCFHCVCAICSRLTADVIF